MVFIGNREPEIISRATNRTLSVFFSVSLPANEKSIHDGLIVKPVRSLDELNLKGKFVETAQVLVFDDTCLPQVLRDPDLLQSINTTMIARTRATEGDFATLSVAEKRIAFDSADLVTKATGVPSTIRMDFYRHAGATIAQNVACIPFPKLKEAVQLVQAKARAAGGELHTIDVSHSAQINAFEYYEMPMRKFTQGHKMTYGEQMMARAYNLLGDMGIPLIAPVRH